MTTWPELVRGFTVHIRKGSVRNSFRYALDCVLIEPESREGPTFFSRNRRNIATVHDRDHGGMRGAGKGLGWAQNAFLNAGVNADRILLLTQPRLFGGGFNPVSFWLAFRSGSLVAAIAEVNNTFGERHSYLCSKPDFSEIRPQDRISVKKIFHVSPFQDVSGDYRFRFDIRPDRVSIHIDFRNGGSGVLATFAGRRMPLTNGRIIASLLRVCFNPLRNIMMIHMQAGMLALKGAKYRPRPAPPAKEISP